MAKQLLDLGPSDVHVSGAQAGYRPGSSPWDSIMADTVSAAQRKRMNASQFGDPDGRRYPIQDAAHVRNASARLEQNKANEPKYSKIRARIARAAKRFGIDSEYNKKTTARSSFRGASRGLRMTTTHPDGTRTEIRHMSAFFSDGTEDDGGKLLLSMPLDKATALSTGDADGRVWVQIAKAGRFFKDGKPFELNSRIFDEVCQNFKSQNIGRVQYDFEHASEMPPSAGNIPVEGTPAQGWAYEFKHNGRQLFALTEWKGLARDYIQNDQYQGVSPAIRWNQKDRESGKPIGAVISSIALTNCPFLTGMAPLVASIGADAAATYCSLTFEEPTNLSASTCCYSANEYMPRIKSALRLHDLATPTEMSDHLDKLREHMDAAEGDHTKTVNGLALSDYALPLRSLVNAHAGMSWDEVFDVVEDLIDAAMDKHIIEDHGGDAGEDSPAPVLNNSAEANPPASTLNDKGGPEMAAPVKSIEQLESELQLMTAERNQLKVDFDAAVATNSQLSAKIEQHELLALNARVDVAFDTYKEKKGLTPASKKTLLTLLKADSAGFEEMFPNLPAPQRTLLTTLTSDGRSQNGTSRNVRVQADAPVDGPDVTTMSARELTRHLMSTEKLPLAAAQNKAMAIINRVRETQRAH